MKENSQKGNASLQDTELRQEEENDIEEMNEGSIKILGVVK